MVAALTGWYSIVRKGGNGKQWQIRARVKRDLLNLVVAARLDGQEVIETPLADYLWCKVNYETKMSVKWLTLFVFGFGGPRSVPGGGARFPQSLATVWRCGGDVRSPCFRSSAQNPGAATGK